MALLAVGLMALNVQREIRLLDSARSDNAQWSLAQTEVEFLEYARLVVTDPFNVGDVRRRFDIFYSRVSTLRVATVFRSLREDPDTAAQIEEITRFLDQSVEIIDSGAAEMIARRSELVALNDAVRPHVRSLASSGLGVFAIAADRQRETVATTMTQLALALAALIGVLAVGVLALNRLNRQISSREREHFKTATRMNTIIDTSLDGVIVSDADGRIIEFNPASEAIFGHKAADVIGREIGDLIVPDPLHVADDAGATAVDAGRGRHVVGMGRLQFDARRATGETFPVELAIQSADTDAETEIFIAFLRDISKRVADDQELVLARDKALANERLKTDFLTTMSHEIRTPLNGLLGNLSLLRDTDLSGAQERYVAYMESSGRLLMSQISDVLDITRYDAGKLSTRSEPVNVDALIRDIINNQSGTAAEYETSLVWRWDGPPMTWIMSDGDRLQHVLINIIGNAVKFTRRGRVTVTAKVVTETDRDVLLLEVSDTGVGIPPDLVDKVFDDFVTGKSVEHRDMDGTGLGLGIAKRFVHALGGEIGVDSSEGRGSTFWVRLPAVPAEPPAAPEEVDAPATGKRPLRVLVIEDNDINRAVARDMIAAEGHSVDEAGDGHEGLERASLIPYDLIFMDINMPVLSGRETTRLIRQQGGPSSRAPIVALTANAVANVRETLLADGIDAILTKPLVRSALQDVLRDPTSIQVAKDVSADVVNHDHSHETRQAVGELAFARLKSRFAGEVDELIAWLTESTQHDYLEVAARVHKVAGGAAVFGAVRLRAALKDVEEAAKSGAAGDLNRHLAAVPEVWANTRKQL